MSEQKWMSYEWIEYSGYAVLTIGHAVYIGENDEKPGEWKNQLTAKRIR